MSDVLAKICADKREHIKAQRKAKPLAAVEREAKAVAALSHPNILSIHDVGVEQGVAYAVMELLTGQTLRERLADGALPVRKAAEVRDIELYPLVTLHYVEVAEPDMHDPSGDFRRLCDGSKVQQSRTSEF